MKVRSAYTISICIFTLLAIICVSCSNKSEDSIPKLSFEDFEHQLYQNNDTVYVINFWATWCKPCIKELPDFEQVNLEYKDQAVKVILVSLDFPNKHNELLIPFVRKQDLQSKVVHLIDVNANAWIDKVDPQWSGAIPATLIYKGNSRTFYEQSLSYRELKNIVESKL